MSKKSPYTGTGKKAQKQQYHGIRKGSQFLESLLRGNKNYKELSESLKGSLEGEKKWFGKTKDPYKDLKQFAPGGKAYSEADFYKSGKQGMKLAEQVLAPTEKEMLRQYQQQAVPNIFGNFGREQGAGSSALNQALAASQTNLQSQIAAQRSELGAQYGLGIAQQNLAERARQQQMQYGAAADIFNAQRAAELGHAERYRDIKTYLASLSTQAAAGLAGTPLQSSYLQKGQGTPSIGAVALGSLLKGAAGGIGRFLAGGPPGAVDGSIGGLNFNNLQ